MTLTAQLSMCSVLIQMWLSQNTQDIILVYIDRIRADHTADRALK